MSRSGSPTGPKMVDAGKAAAVEGVETSAIAQDRIGAGRREAANARMEQLIHVLGYLLGSPRLQAAADEYYHAACYGAFVANLATELRELLAAAYVAGEITHASGQRLEAVVHIMKTVNDGGGSNRDNFENARPGREAAAPRATFTKDVTKDSGKGNV
eukprot:jgi/Tetstr1/425717/TSEL_016137.t1